MTAVKMTTGGVSVSRRGGSAGQTSYSCERAQSHYTTPGVREERTGWRDQALSERHRLYGCDCPAVDLDFILLEYDNSAPTALIEYKHVRARKVDPKSPSIRAIGQLADAAGLPFFVVFYDPGSWSFSVTQMNRKPRRMFARPDVVMTEREYVRFLYSLRGRMPDWSILRGLGDTKPGEESPCQF